MRSTPSRLTAVWQVSPGSAGPPVELLAPLLSTPPLELLDNVPLVASPDDDDDDDEDAAPLDEDGSKDPPPVDDDEDDDDDDEAAAEEELCLSTGDVPPPAPGVGTEQPNTNSAPRSLPTCLRCMNPSAPEPGRKRAPHRANARVVPALAAPSSRRGS